MNAASGDTALVAATDHRAPSDRWPVIGGVLLSALYVWILVWLALAVVAPYLVWRWQPLVITSGSMAPLIRAGDVMLAAAQDDPVTAGHVIAYRDPANPGSLNTHRVVSVDDDGSYRTRGDANATVDSTPVPPDSVMGRGRLLVPMAGLPLLWLSDSPLLFAAWTVATLIAVLVVIGPRGRPPTAPPKGPRPPNGDPGDEDRRRSATRPAGRRTSPVLARRTRARRSVVRRRRTATLLVVVVAVMLTAATVVGRSAAAFSTSTSNTGSSYQANGPLAPPSGLTANQTCSGSTPSADLSWTATPDTWADGYTLTRDTDPPQTIAGRTTTSMTDGPLVNGTPYTWQLAATAGPWTSSSINVAMTPNCVASPAFVTSTTFSDFGAIVALTVPASTQTGDLLITFTGTDDPNVNPPAGWALLRADDNVTHGAYSRVYWRLATAGDPGSTYAWTGSGDPSNGGAVMLVYRGVDQTTPFDAHGGTVHSGTTSLTAPSITTTVGDTRLVALYFHEAGSLDSATIAPPPGMAEVFEGQNLNRTIEIADEEFATTGATGSRTATANQLDDGTGVLLALRPE